jgi:hypothetical protein
VIVLLGDEIEASQVFPLVVEHALNLVTHNLSPLLGAHPVVST